MTNIHLILGATSGDPDVYGEHIPAGTPEWQVSDGPPGFRSSSVDFLSLEEALRYIEYNYPGEPMVPHILKDHIQGKAI